MENIDEVYELFKSSKKSLEILFKQYLDNPNNSLEDKWNKLITVGKDLNIKGNWIFNPEGIDWNKYTLYDDFSIERYETYNIESLLEITEEGEIPLDIELFKKSCVKEGKYYYKCDW